jgi:hypothetical protein
MSLKNHKRRKEVALRKKAVAFLSGRLFNILGQVAIGLLVSFFTTLSVAVYSVSILSMLSEFGISNFRTDWEYPLGAFLLSVLLWAAIVSITRYRGNVLAIVAALAFVALVLYGLADQQVINLRIIWKFFFYCLLIFQLAGFFIACAVKFVSLIYRSQRN